MRLLMKLFLLLAFLTVVYQYSQCTDLTHLSDGTAKQSSFKLRYSQLLTGASSDPFFPFAAVDTPPNLVSFA